MARHRNGLAWMAVLAASVGAVSAVGGVAVAQDGEERVTTPELELKFEVKPARAPHDPDAPLVPLEDDASAGNLLNHLERKDSELQRLRADVSYTRVQALAGDTQVRVGRMYYERGGALADGGAARRFAIEFDTLIVDRVARDERTAWGFDGEWLIEKDYQTKQYVRRRIAKPGAEVDPLRLGNGGGAIPLPIGQRRDEVERFFDAEMVGALDGLVPDADALDDPDAGFREFVRYMGGDAGVEGVYQLKLTPKAGTEAAEDYREMRLWYQKGTLLPLMSRAIDRKRDISTVQLLNVDTEHAVDRGVIDIGPPPADTGWVVKEEDRLFE